MRRRKLGESKREFQRWSVAETGVASYHEFSPGQIFQPVTNDSSTAVCLLVHLIHGPPAIAEQPEQKQNLQLVRREDMIRDDQHPNGGRGAGHGGTRKRH